MNKKLLCAALLCGLGVAQAASAQEFDDRWYVAGSTGVNFQDSNRHTDDALFGTLGFGKFWTPNWSVDAELNYQNPTLKFNNNLNWSQYGAAVAARYHFRNADSKWWPYVKLGLGLQRHEQEFVGTCGAGSGGQATCPAQHSDNNAAAELGAGLQFDFGRVDLRTEVGARMDFDKVQAPTTDGVTSVTTDRRYGLLAAPQYKHFTDLLASVGLTVALGPDRAAPVVAAPAPTQTCADMDSDGDGVNDCNDKCPASTAGQAVGPDGCPVPLTIDLKGVNFDFDKSKLRPDAIAILNDGIEILKRYPDMRVEVAGHTDLCGSDAYNQSLSERRAKAVYAYLTANGIDAGRLVGPVGYGESRPLVQTAQTKPDCMNETNRRTELNVQNQPAQ